MEKMKMPLAVAILLLRKEDLTFLSFMDQMEDFEDK